MDIGHQLKLYMKRLGLTQKDLADQLGVSQPFISAVCRGEKYPSFENVLSICTLLNITPNELFGVEPESDLQLSDIEQKILYKLRLLDDRDIGAVMAMIDALLATSESKSPISIDSGKNSTKRMA